ncbi:MAG TPA: iron-containing alcohol dehydrogenase, partial [Candidatus Enterococcus stercoravium]|nr:iron-containing alcohol dehydrogenase [Candidatus Enterococcus stercoravium]
MLTVHLKDHQYDIQVKRGCLAQVGPFLQDLWQPQKVAIITDDNVASLYEEQVRVAVKQAGFEVVTHIVPHGETSKSLAEAEEIYAFLADEGFTRSDGIIALGGGVIGDLAAFAASTYMRGIHFIQIPTTLLAQVDS